MKKILTAALCAASMMLASCATMLPPSTATAAQTGPTIYRADAANDSIAASAKVIVPFLPAERQASME